MRPLGSTGSSHFRNIMSSSGVKVRDSEAMPPGTGEGKGTCLDAVRNPAGRRNPSGSPFRQLQQLSTAIEPLHPLHHITQLWHVPLDRAGGSPGRCSPRQRCSHRAPVPTGDTLPWQGEVLTPRHKPHRYHFWHRTQFPTAQRQAPSHRHWQSSLEFASARKEKKISFSHRTQIPPPEPPASSGDVAGAPCSEQ